MNESFESRLSRGPRLPASFYYHSAAPSLRLLIPMVTRTNDVERAKHWDISPVSPILVTRLDKRESRAIALQSSMFAHLPCREASCSTIA